MRNSLVAFQAALSLVLVIGTGLFVRSLGRLNAVDLGLEPSTLIAVRLDDFGSASRRGAPARPGTLDLETVDDLERTIRSWPDVERVAQATLPPFGATRSVSLVVPGVEEVEVPGEPSPVITGVTGEYFATIGTRAITGRLLGTGDTRDAPYVVVVSRSLAAHLWSGDAMGKCMKVGDGLAPCSTVVGVVEDFRENPTAEGGLKRYFVPQEQVATSGSLSTVVLRARTRADVPKIEQRLESVRVQGSRPIVDVVARRVDRHLKLWRTGLALFGVLGAIALTLSAVGLGSVLMASVSERTHEIGVRVALGASRPAVIGMVLRSGMTLVAIGLAIGLAVATAGARLMSAVVFGVSVFDGPVYAVSALTLIVVGLAAAVLPSVRAVRVDPVRTLRED